MRTALYTASDLMFNAERRVYTLPDGRLVPSIAQILRSVGIPTDFDQIAAISDTLVNQIGYRRALGMATHMDCQAFDDGELDWSRVHADVRPYVEAWRVFRENTGLTLLTRERRVFDPTRFYCGTVDGIFCQRDGRNVLIDVTLGDPDDGGAMFQTAACMRAYLLEHQDEVIHERWAVRLTPENGVPYRIRPYTDWMDFGRFAAFVTAYHAQAARRRRVS